MISDRLSTIVLAGGLSRRMGRDKALLEIQGVPLLKHVTDRVLPFSQPVFVVTAWPEAYQSIVAPDCHLITDEISAGPMMGFAQGLAKVETNWILLLSCDLPQLDQTTILRWIQHLGAVPETAIAYLPQGEKGWEPLCGFYRLSCREALQTFIDQGGRSFQKWLQTQVVEVLSVEDRRVLFNCNTPEDWQQVSDQYK
ncbi:molybdenum cofactor guanylyltransferase [filamentous cyanobacterium LEGE 11480]|uniref:Probable molybdenum cofactor guanylyltransferase n=1 Tax=Romeriopsis navalis LEGE 11480 TaxID=2777977 RepID=A0A928VL35_9CYAN|nr:molybdenum cofactor guanylyltransferase [Romeriopsis navalis]MBE9028601.1 molybdenum cofactor guanylyltransferase [Romeriopsis navalis LEGE 11480]